MLTLINQVCSHLKKAVQTAFGDVAGDINPTIVHSNNSIFGDYQSNLAMGLSRELKQPPRTIAEKVLKELDLNDLCDSPEIAGPGFINLRVKKAYINAALNKIKTDPRLGIEKVYCPQKVIVEYSSPNIAKEMHVGHVRTTIIGDCLAKVYEFLGHDVLRLSHIGDWGTQYGMLIAYLKEVSPSSIKEETLANLGDFVTFYKQAKARFDTDPKFQDTARQEVVRLQGGDSDNLKAWRLLCDLSSSENEIIYKRLDIQGLIDRGESSYNSMLPGIVQNLERIGLLVENQGAKCVFLEGFTNEEGQPLPLIVQKKDGGYNYATTDLAALQSRITKDKAERLIYVVGAEQSDHFAQFFQVARRAGWLPNKVIAVHVPTGLVQGADGKKLKTRSGETIRLRELLDEAVTRARAELDARLKKDQKTESEEFKADVSETIAMGAIKYADLSHNRITNYIFDFDKMLSLQGNTAPYMMYAYVRVRGIGRKANVNFEELAKTASIELMEIQEFDLAKHILRFDEILAVVANEYLPNRICDYLFELSQKFNQFYEHCSVLGAEGPTKNSRLLLCDLTARTIKLGLFLLGIRVLERM